MSASEQSVEHRWGARVAILETAALRSAPGEESHALLRDASLSGAFVETARKPALFSRVAVRPVEGTGDWIEAWVVRAEMLGIGLEWIEPASKAVVSLLAAGRGVARRPAKAQQAERRSTLEMAIQSDSLLRDHSEIDSDEFDVQG